MTKTKIFPCLNCGKDTGCPNKLVCNLCRKTNIDKQELDYYSPIRVRKKQIKKVKVSL
jgi:hypothetical protein